MGWAYGAITCRASTQHQAIPRSKLTIYTRFTAALADQPSHALLTQPFIPPIAVALFTTGTTLVLTSMWALGITGTYLGDYFGILMDEMVTGFPFNVTGSPMYDGSTLNFIATALWYGKPAGLLLSAGVWLAYKIALMYEIGRAHV